MQEACYETSDTLIDMDAEEFYSKLNTFKWHIFIHAVDKGILVHELPIMFTGGALVFFQTTVEPKQDLVALHFDHLFAPLKRRFNTAERNLRLMHECNSISMQ